MTTGDLKRIDSRPIPDSREEIRAFMVVRNESFRLESILKHYRQLGVNRFFVADGGSTDGSLDLLARAPDAHVFSAAGNDGIGWINSLLDTYGSGHWTLTIESGELFVYPHYEELELPLFCKYLNYVGSQAVPCVSLDMYAASPIRDAVHSPGAPLLDTCPYFDAAPYDLVRTEDSPYFRIHGGVRARAFGQAGANSAAVLSSVPLVRWRAGMRYLGSTANITPVTLAKILAAVLRFEFLSDFAERSPAALTLCDGLSTNLYSGSSVRFKNSAQLLELGLMKTETAYEKSVQLTSAARLEQSA